MKTAPTPTSEMQILIVDDDKIVSLMHGYVLEKILKNSKPAFFRNGKAALEYIGENPQQESSFLVLLDLNMPVMDGWEFLETLKELEDASKIFVIVITSSIRTDDLYRALEYKNVLGFSSKPFTINSMKSLLEFPEIQKLFLDMEYQALENGSW